MNFIITVDTEADNQWARPSGESLKNISFLPRFQKLCHRFNLPPTYLVTYEVASDEEAITILKSFQTEGAEIGAHLHPWTTPPFSLSRDTERLIHRFPHELSKEELKNKLLSLTEIITKNFGQPVSFRSGRWGFNDGVAKELSGQGYLIDCSVTPKLSWQNTKGDPNKNGGPDYRQAPLIPYYRNGILEIPLTVVATGIFNKENCLVLKIFNFLPENLFKKIINRLFFRIKTLRIFPETSKNDLEAIILSAKKNNLPVIEFMIHSSELMPGGSKYGENPADIEKIYKNLEELFFLVNKHKIKGLTLKEYFKMNYS